MRVHRAGLAVCEIDDLSRAHSLPAPGAILPPALTQWNQFMFPLPHSKPPKLFCPCIAEGFSFFDLQFTKQGILIISPRFLVLLPLKGLWREFV